MENSMSKRKIVFLILIIQILLFTGINSIYAVSTTTLVDGLMGAKGIAIDESKHHLYFVEYQSGTLKRIDLPLTAPSKTPGTLPLPITTIASGFSFPVDVQLDLAHGYAYVTDGGVGLTAQSGNLWKVNLTDGTKSLVTIKLANPQQLFLDMANNRAFTVSRNDGRLRSIDLTTGIKIPVFKGLDQPVGLAITQDRRYAYITELGPMTKRISTIDLTTGTKLSEIKLLTMTAPFFLAWTDINENSLYIVEQNPANKLFWFDLLTSTLHEAVTIPQTNPASVAMKSAATPLYISTEKTITLVDLALDSTQPDFMGVGHVPISSINSEGYATTDPGYFFQAKNAPFGGTLNIFGNLSNFKSLGAVYYEVLVSKNSDPFIPLGLSWNMYKWDPALAKYKLVAVAPEPGTNKYKIPDEYPLNSAWWYPSFLMMRWPSGENALYTFAIKLYDAGEVDITPAGFNELRIRVDNTPPTVNIHNIYQNNPPSIDNLEPCDIVDNGNNEFTFKITAYDPEGHLYSYRLSALYGNNKSLLIVSDSYNSHINPPPPPYSPVSWCGVVNVTVPAPPKAVPCNCAYTFDLHAWGRTINGYNRIQHVRHYKSITINLPILSTCTSP